MPTNPEDRIKNKAVSTAGSPKERMTFLLPVDLIEELKNAVYWTPSGITLSDVATVALRESVKYLQRKYNRGKPFRKREAELKGGRPIKL